MDKPFSQAAENNKGPILQVLQQAFAEQSSVLEIGSGTGQHAEFMARALPRLRWQPSELPASLEILGLGLREAALANLLPPIALDVCHADWKLQGVDAVFTANTLHIMPWSAVPCLFEGAGRLLGRGGRLCVYGPFRYHGDFTTRSNADFDRWLKSQGAHQGIRDFEAVNELATGQGLRLLEDRDMPANNQLLTWEKS